MTVKRRGPLPGFHAKSDKPPALRIRKKKPVTEDNLIGMSAARQAKPETMHPWTGFIVTSLADIPAKCICDWIYHKGVLEIKYVNGLCLVRHGA
jgi:hypothetical protein